MAQRQAVLADFLPFQAAAAYAVHNVFSGKNKKNNHWQNDYG